MSNDLLTTTEREIIDLLSKAHNLHNKLPKQHPMHDSEFCTAVHHAQRIIMSRPVARHYGWTKEELIK